MRIEDDPEARPSWAVLLIVPIVIGAIGGALVGVVVMVIEDWLLGDLVLGLPGLWFALPAVGVFVLTRFALVKVAKSTTPGTAELYPTYYHETDRRYPIRQAPGRLLSGATTVASVVRGTRVAVSADRRLDRHGDPACFGRRVVPRHP